MRPARAPLVWTFLRRDLRDARRDLLLLTLAFTLAAGVPMAAAAAARRAQTAIERRQELTGSIDGMVAADTPGIHTELTEELVGLLEGRREVRDVETTWYVPTGLVFDQGV